MFFLAFGNLMLYGIQWISETLRYQRYGRIMQHLVHRCSVLVQRTRKAHAGVLIHESLLNGTPITSEKVELEDDYVQLSSVEPMQEVDLSTWTSYLNICNKAPQSEGYISVLLEARRPRNLNKFVSRELRISPAYRCHVLSHGCPIAWKTAEPFGIILHCTLANLVILTDAFGQGRLTLDEDLQLIGLVTVKTVGNPQNLIPHLSAPGRLQEVGVASLADLTHPYVTDGAENASGVSPCTDTIDSETAQALVPETSSQDSHHLKEEKGMDVTVDSTSSVTYRERSFSTKTNDPPITLDKISDPVEKASDIDDKAMETFSDTPKIVTPPSTPNAKSEYENTAGIASVNPSAQASSATSFACNANNGPAVSASFKNNQKPSMKPPNILVYCGVKDTARKFAQVQQSLSACINSDAYTIYHLKHESLLSAPWGPNTALLVVSFCSQLRRDVEDVIANYVLHNGGNLLSFNSSIDSVFAQREEDKELGREKLLTLKLDNAQTLTSIGGGYCYSSFTSGSQILISRDSISSSAEENRGNSGAATCIGNGERKSSLSTSQKALVVKTVCDSGGVAVLSQLLLERDPAEFAVDQESFSALKRSNSDRLCILRELLTSLDIDTRSGPAPNLTPCCLLGRRIGLKETLVDSVKPRLTTAGLLKSSKLSLQFVKSPEKINASSSVLPVVITSEHDVKMEFFDMKPYWQNLRTSKLGQLVFYTDVITSTMPVFDSLLFSIPETVGPIAIAGRQTNGQGRGDNAWLSPVGCAMFTLPLTLSLDSDLGQRVSFLQHMVSLAVVHSVVTLPGYEKLNLRLKWPNDIYYGREIKVGGVLVKSTILGSVISATIGCGFNVSNSNPTICINDIIRQHNTSHPDLPDLQPLSSGQLIARTVTILEGFAEQFERRGHQMFCEMYYQHWLHTGTQVDVQSDTHSQGEIQGLDEYGFLSIRLKDGTLTSVQPDGNSFDMMHNLIRAKS